jgi:6-phosphogluconolactonase (cycloisomerase 2 family)
MTLAMALSLTSCARTYTVAYVYMTGSNKSAQGVITGYEVDYQTGALVRIGNPTQAGVNPTRLAITPNGLCLYVVNQDDNTVQPFTVNGDGTLVAKTAVKVGGTIPTGAAIDQQGKFLYVTYTYQAGYSAANPGPGGITIFPINSDYSLGTASNVNIGNNPVAITTTMFNNYVYVVDQETVPNATVLGFTENTSTGALTPTPGTNITTVGGKTVATGYSTGTVPSAIVAAPTARFVYVTDQATNQLYGYTVSSSGALVSMVNGPFTTGLFPVAIAIEPRGKYMYVSNFNASTVSAYAIDQATGSPTASVGSTAVAVKAGPTCLSVDPALGEYLYVSNSQDGTVSGMKLDSHNGGLSNIQNTPFPGSGTPTCVITAPNGQHATQNVQP